jgi:hypothetical protein
MSMDLTAAFTRLLAEQPPPIVHGGYRHGEPGRSKAERDRTYRDRKKEKRLENVAVLDMETDPFDNQNPGRSIFPFLAVLYADSFDPIIIWEENHDRFISRVIESIEALPGRYTIFAHNGGKFDYMFLLSRIRGMVKFKGRAIMSCRIGPHELRDSFHIIPEKLANWQKDSFDYSKLKKSVRSDFRDEIIRYCLNDCKYLLDIVKRFLAEFGFKISIGQAAMCELRKHYKVERVTENMDLFLRSYFYGGRVECLQGSGQWGPGYKLFDVNSMYPYVMANFQHPIGGEFWIRSSGKPNANTVFLELECDNYGALIGRDENGELSSAHGRGVFKTTIWEYQTALRLGLIDRVIIKQLVDCQQRSDFSKFVLPLYYRRQAAKSSLKELEHAGQKGSAAYNDLKKDDIFLKLLLNNAYGKFAQNSRRFKESFVTDPEQFPADDPLQSAIKKSLEQATDPDEIAKLKKRLAELQWSFLPIYESPRYWIYERPCPSHRFNNVATAASITGAARAVLLEAIELASDPIYCDTDSIICRGLNGLPIHGSDLGAWDCESEFDEVLIGGKKLYGCKVSGLPDGHKDRIKIRSKGVAGLSWFDLGSIIKGQIVEKLSAGPTIKRTGDQFYMLRKIRATAPVKPRKLQPLGRRVA